MTLGARLMRLIAPQDEDLRMELRKAAACSEANAEDLMRTMHSIPSEHIRELMRRVEEGKK